jgi:hypothetical protein
MEELLEFSLHNGSYIGLGAAIYPTYSKRMLSFVRKGEDWAVMKALSIVNC